jgi:hypothetical protein
MVAAPADAPYKTPEVRPMDAVAGMLLAQVPPDVVSASVDELPWQRDVVPVIGTGNGFTVIVIVS